MERVILPKLGLTMEEATVTRWLKQEGDRITRGEPLAEIEMEKANAEIEAPCDGFLKKIVVAEGHKAPVESVLAYLAMNEEELRAAFDHASVPSALPREEPAPTAPPTQDVSGQPEEGKIRAAPAARRLAKELGLDLAAIRGTGPAGRITPEDVRQAHEKAQPATLSRVEQRRAVIAGLMRSVTTIPHINVCREVGADGLVQVKQQLSGITYTDLLAKVVAAMVEQHPVFKTALAGDDFRETSSVNLGIVIDTGDSLVIPVLKDAAAKPLPTLSSELRELAHRARNRQLQAEQLDGATVTLSNLGMYGVDFFTAVIPYGQIAILTVGKIRRCVNLELSSTGESESLWLNLVVDHRLVDGAAAARALSTIADLLRPQAIRRVIGIETGEGQAFR
jgi:pyruvate dehydrogenase E2 component (dihydrolipoamide acetyltransferase)